MSAHEPGEAYDGPAGLVTDDAHQVAHPVEVQLRGFFQPLDGRFHWYGRIAETPALAAVRSGATVTLQTPYGEATGRVSDLDPWRRLRIAGTGRPPF